MITSTSNVKTKNVIKYAKSAKERRKADVFLVEGIRVFMEIPHDLMRETYVTESFYEKNSSKKTALFSRGSVWADRSKPGWKKAGNTAYYGTGKSPGSR